MASAIPLSYFARDPKPTVALSGVLICLMAVSAATSHGQEPVVRKAASARDAYELGIEYYKAKEFESAVQSFSDAIERDSKFVEAYEYRARAHTKLSEATTDERARDNAFLRAIEDRQTAGEIRAARELGFEFDQYSMRYAAILAAYVIAWALIIYYWRSGQISGGWLAVAFFLGPLGFLFVLLLALTAPKVERIEDDQPFGDSQLERTLRSYRRSDDDSDDVGAIVQCPHCGRENSITTKICPRCESRLS